MQALLFFPLKDKSFVLYLPPPREVDWYGKKALFMLIKDASHPTRPKGDDGLVRAKNGGNFYVVMPDEKQPEAACKIFGLTNNLYNGWIPKTYTESMTGERIWWTVITSILRTSISFPIKDRLNFKHSLELV